MTIDTAIAMCDERRPNQYSREDKTSWLSRLDGRIYQDIITMYHHPSGALGSGALPSGDSVPGEPASGEQSPFTGYAGETTEDTELLAAWPHDEMYPLYLFAMVDFHNNDLQRYNASAAMFDRAYGEYKAWYIRNHMPVKRACVSYGGSREQKGSVNNPLG